MKSNNNENITEVKEKEDVKNELSKRVFYIQQSKKTTSSCSRGVFIVVNKNITQNDLYNVDVENFLDDYFPDEGDIWFKVGEDDERTKRRLKGKTEKERKIILSYPSSDTVFTIVDKTEHFISSFDTNGELDPCSPLNYNTKYLPEDTPNYYNHIFIVNVSVDEDGTLIKQV
jgi:hypothetical protein